MNKLLACIGLAISVVCGAPALAHQVYPGCDVPVSSATAKAWWVDPVNGKSPAAGGLGTQAAPWNSLQGVMTDVGSAPVAGYTRPLLSSVPYRHAGAVTADQLGSPPVQPGDTINLMTGNYGSVAVGEYLVAANNPDWVTIQAAPGQTPLFTTLYIRSASKWIFTGVKVQGLVAQSKLPLVTVTDQGAALPTTDIILENLDISSQDSVAGITRAIWSATFRMGLQANSSAGNGTNGEPNTTCVSVTGSHIHNVQFGAQMMSNNGLFSYNEIDHFGDDAFDYAANNLLITNNHIHDAVALADGIHMDAMQGQNGPISLGVAYNKFSNIVIDSNTIINQEDMTNPFPSYLQGIDAFDEDWTNMMVTNNVIISSACWGTALASIHDSLVANNTVLADGLIATPGCTLWLSVGGTSHEGLPSTNTRVANNLVGELIVGAAGDTGLTYDHNVILNKQAIAGTNLTTGAVFYFVSAGTDANGNVIPAASIPFASQFVAFNPATASYDLHLLPSSVAIAAASEAIAPALDIAGVRRGIPAGAYAGN